MIFAGHLRLRAAQRAHGRTALAEQSFRAPFHLSKPYWDADARTLLVHVVNPTAGILAGDQLRSEISAEADAALLVTTPSASRVFAMREGVAECHQHFSVATNAWLEVLPEPLVPHRGSRYHQATCIEVEPGGGLFFVDQLIPGRLGHGEAWAWSELRMNLEIHVGDDLVLRERLAHGAAELRDVAAFTGSGPTACFANAVLIAGEPHAPTWRSRIEALHGEGIWIGASALRHGWTIKIIAADPLRLRTTVGAVRQILADTFPRLRCSTRKL